MHLKITRKYTTVEEILQFVNELKQGMGVKSLNGHMLGLGVDIEITFVEESPRNTTETERTTV